MTKISVLGQELAKEEEKKIILEGCLLNRCDNTNYDSFSEGWLDPASFDELILLSHDRGYNKDVILGRKEGNDIILFGHWNDGVV